jgi:xanthine dehydrogenase accessory factor
MRCLVRGVGDVGSAVAHALHGAGHEVAIHDGPTPTAHRRGMAFADAMFDGHAALTGVEARKTEKPGDVAALWAVGVIAVSSFPFDDLRALLPWDVLIDARMRKRAHPEDQRSLATLVIGLGPGFTVDENCHRAVETGWDDLGTILEAGSTAPLHGEPRAILGHARDRLVYAPCAGLFTSTRRIGESVRQGEIIATVGGQALVAPLSGILRGLTRSNVPVESATKTAEIDPRGDPASAFGLGERPRRIADAVLRILSQTPRRD